jgi:hypothetical protein
MNPNSISATSSTTAIIPTSTPYVPRSNILLPVVKVNNGSLEKTTDISTSAWDRLRNRHSGQEEVSQIIFNKDADPATWRESEYAVAAFITKLAQEGFSADDVIDICDIISSIFSYSGAKMQVLTALANSELAIEKKRSLYPR